MTMDIVGRGSRPRAAAALAVHHPGWCGLYRHWSRLADQAKALPYVRSSVLNGCRSALRRRPAAPLAGRPGPGGAGSAAAVVASAEAAVLSGEQRREVMTALRADGTTIEFPLSAGAQFDGQVRLLDTTAPGSSLRQARLVLDFGPTPSVQVAAGPHGPDSIITPAGGRIGASTASVSGEPARTLLTVSEFSAATGVRATALDPVTLRGNRVLYRPVLWSSPDGITQIAF